MTYRAHPGLYEPEPVGFKDALTALTYGKVDWAGFNALGEERAAWERRHAPELERRAYEASKPVRVPRIGPPKAVRR